MQNLAMILRASLLTPLLFLAPEKLLASVRVIYDASHTVSAGQVTLSIAQSAMQAGHHYTIVARPIPGQTSSYGDPYIWSVTYDSRFIGGRRVVYQSRHAGDAVEVAHLQKDMWNAGENRAEFWVRCELSAVSCLLRLSVYERQAGTFDRKTFYREGVEYRVIDGQNSLYKEFYHPTRRNGDYGLQVDFEAGRYIYLYRSDGFDTANSNTLAFWIRSSGSVNEDDLSIALTTGSDQLVTSWLPMADYLTIAQSSTWYRARVPLSDLNPPGLSIRGVAIRSETAGLVYFDDMELTREGAEDFRLPLPAGEEWYLTVEVGGEPDCTNPGRDLFHSEYNAYYSIDFAPRTLASGNGSSPLANVEILTAASGRVIEASATASGPNGYYVRIDHDEPYDGSGLTSYYLHLRSSASALLGTQVEQGKILGYMGSSGQSTATHLHFQMKYNGDSTIGAARLGSVRVEGLLMTEYIAGCRTSIPPTGFYPSTNVPRP